MGQIAVATPALRIPQPTFLLGSCSSPASSISSRMK